MHLLTSTRARGTVDQLQIRGQPFAVKIYVGGINAVSGEPARETEVTMMRRLKLMKSHMSIQDYLVPPKQLWLDGIASTDGTVRQFVAMPLDTGYSVEAQVSGEEVVGGIQIEVTPSKLNAASYTIPKPPGTSHFSITVENLMGKCVRMNVSALHTVEELKGMIHDIEGIPPDQQRLLYSGRQILDGRTLGEFVKAHSIVHLILRLRGGGYGPDRSWRAHPTGSQEGQL